MKNNPTPLTKELPDHLGYIIYSDGRVYSNKTDRFLKQTERNKYLFVSLNGKTLRIHRLVAQAFIPNPERKPQVNHKDGNTRNNHVDNLEWATSQENVRHSWKNGLSENSRLSGENSPFSKLSLKQVKEIKKKYIRKEYGSGVLAKEYGVSNMAILRIIRGETWTTALKEAEEQDLLKALENNGR